MYLFTLGTRPIQSKIKFELSPELSVPCVYWSKISKSTLPSLKKQCNLSYDEDMPDSGKLSRNIIYRNPNDPDEELQFEDRVKGYKYGPQYIPLGGMEEMLKLNSPAVIKLLGFVSSSQIQRYHFMESTIILSAKSDNESACSFMASLSSVLQKKNQAAIVRFVKKDNSDPWLAALLPSESNKAEYASSLILQRLPCMEDIRNFLFPPLLSPSELNSKQHDVISSAINANTIHLTSSDDLLLYNPSMLALLLKLQEKIISPFLDTKQSLAIDSSSLTVDNMFRLPVMTGKSNNNSVIDTWKNVYDEFTLTVVEKKSKKRKVYWSDIAINEENNSMEVSNDSKTIKSESGNDMLVNVSTYIQFTLIDDILLIIIVL
jgi:ATP-dependent DNA helicase 2 subunit 2